MANQDTKLITINLTSDDTYKGQNKWFAAFDGFVGYGSAMIVVPALVAAAYHKIRKIPFTMAEVGESFKSKWLWGGAVFVATANAIGSYFNAKWAEDEHYKTVIETRFLREQVAQLGEKPAEITEFNGVKNFVSHENSPAASHAEQALADKRAAQEATHSV